MMNIILTTLTTLCLFSILYVILILFNDKTIKYNYTFKKVIV